MLASYLAFSSVSAGGYLVLLRCFVTLLHNWHDKKSQNLVRCQHNPSYKSFPSDLRITIIIIPIL